MQLYHPTKGLKGIRTVLNQFNEVLLSERQKILLRERLLILSFHDHHGNISETAREFSTSRSYVRTLIQIREEEGLRGLIPQKTGPKEKRGFEFTFEEKAEIEKYAKMFPDWSHKKLKIFFPQHSTSTIYRYLKKRDLLVRNRCPAFHRKPSPRSAWKVLRKRLPKDYEVEKPGDLIVLDSITEFIGPHFKKLYFITCVDIATRIGLALCTSHLNSFAAQALLQKMEQILQTKIKSVLTDNGGEFLAHFHRACEEEKIFHFFTRPRTPKDNAIAERFNLTLQRHLYWRADLTLHPDSINEVLADWLIEYNCLRPHESLQMRTPAAYYFATFYTPRKNMGVDLKLWNRTLPCRKNSRR